MRLEVDGAARDGHPGPAGALQRPDPQHVGRAGAPSATRSPTRSASSSCAARGGRSRPASTAGCSPSRACPARRAWPAWPPCRRPSCSAAIESFQDGFTWLRRGDLVTIAAVQGHAIGAGLPARAGLRPAGGRRRREARHARDLARAGARPDRHPPARPSSSGCPARWRCAPPAGSSAPPRRSRWGWPTRPCPATSWTTPPATSPRPCCSAPASAVRALKPLLTAAPGQRPGRPQLDLERRDPGRAADRDGGGPQGRGRLTRALGRGRSAGPPALTAAPAVVGAILRGNPRGTPA